MNYIISILEENRLYDDNYNEVYTNKIDLFMRNYKINRTSKNKIPNSIKRDSNGFLNLDNEPYIISDLVPNGHNESFWMLFSNGSRILLKNLNEHELQNELLFKYLCKWLNIPCANNDAAIFQGQTFLLSPSFLSPNEYLLDYYNIEGKNIIDLNKLLLDAFKIKQDLFIRKMLTVDILAKNYDRFLGNFKVIKSNKQIRICPLFDNELLGNYGKGKMIRLTSFKGFIDNAEIIKYLMQDPAFKEWCFKNIVLNPMPNFKQEVFNEKKLYIDDGIFNEFNNNVNEGKALILDLYNGI